MYIVGSERLTEEGMWREAYQLLEEMLDECPTVQYSAEVFVDTDTPGRYQVKAYGGLVLGLVVYPPSLVIEVESAEIQTAACDCEYSGIDPLSEFGLSTAEMELSDELDILAGVEPQDPHFEILPEEIGSVVTIQFDHIGWYGAYGVMDHMPNLED